MDSAWFQSYLVGSKQSVVLRGHSSKCGYILASVSQGSVLGLLLFLVYINYIIDVVNCNLKMFADDTCLYVSAEDSNISANILIITLRMLESGLTSALSTSTQTRLNPCK